MSKELSDLVVKENHSSLNKFGKALKKTGKVIYQTFAQAPDADVLLATSISLSYLETDIIPLEILFWAATIKQYLWGWMSFKKAQGKIAEYGDITPDELDERWDLARLPPCSYFGTRYAMKDFRKNFQAHSILTFK